MEQYNISELTCNRSVWLQTTLYEIIDAVTMATGEDDVRLIEDITMDIFKRRQLRKTRTWARIKWILPPETNADFSTSYPATA